MTFADVTAIRISSGDVSKITETNSGRVLWSKPSSGGGGGEGTPFKKRARAKMSIYDSIYDISRNNPFYQGADLINMSSDPLAIPHVSISCPAGKVAVVDVGVFDFHASLWTYLRGPYTLENAKVLSVNCSSNFRGGYYGYNGYAEDGSLLNNGDARFSFASGTVIGSWVMHQISVTQLISKYIYTGTVRIDVIS
ncbi:MAG: hypothetical protein IJR14_01940 [Synergistaceae bacterium]|nr:hypothetical protein [Synergistaceae bacterium]